MPTIETKRHNDYGVKVSGHPLCVNGVMRVLNNYAALVEVCGRLLFEIDPATVGAARCRVCGNHPAKHVRGCAVADARRLLAKLTEGV